MKVGCAITSFSTENKQMKSVYLVCNYSMTNMMGDSIYDSGKSASKCQSGLSKKYQGLCTAREVV